MGNVSWRSTVLSVFGDSMIWPAFKLSLLVTFVATCVVVLIGMAFASCTSHITWPKRLRSAIKWSS
jgi:ABC-type sulfate transport system permease component